MNPGAKEDLLCLAVLVAAIPLFPVQDSYCGQVYTCTTNNILHYSKPEKAILNWVVLVKGEKICVKLLNKVCS